MIFKFQLKEEIPLSLKRNEIFELLYHRVSLMPKGVSSNAIGARIGFKYERVNLS
jgi:hypothetical protein